MRIWDIELSGFASRTGQINGVKLFYQDGRPIKEHHPVTSMGRVIIGMEHELLSRQNVASSVKPETFQIRGAIHFFIRQLRSPASARLLTNHAQALVKWAAQHRL